MLEHTSEVHAWTCSIVSGDSKGRSVPRSDYIHVRHYILLAPCSLQLANSLFLQLPLVENQVWGFPIPYYMASQAALYGESSTSKNFRHLWTF